MLSTKIYNGANPYVRSNPAMQMWEWIDNRINFDWAMTLLEAEDLDPTRELGDLHAHLRTMAAAHPDNEPKQEEGEADDKFNARQSAFEDTKKKAAHAAFHVLLHPEVNRGYVQRGGKWVPSGESMWDSIARSERMGGDRPYKGQSKGPRSFADIDEPTRLAVASKGSTTRPERGPDESDKDYKARVEAWKDAQEFGSVKSQYDRAKEQAGLEKLGDFVAQGDHAKEAKKLLEKHGKGEIKDITPSTITRMVRAHFTGKYSPAGQRMARARESQPIPLSQVQTTSSVSGGEGGEGGGTTDVIADRSIGGSTHTPSGHDPVYGERVGKALSTRDSRSKREHGALALSRLRYSAALRKAMRDDLNERDARGNVTRDVWPRGQKHPSVPPQTKHVTEVWKRLSKRLSAAELDDLNRKLTGMNLPEPRLSGGTRARREEPWRERVARETADIEAFTGAGSEEDPLGHSKFGHGLSRVLKPEKSEKPEGQSESLWSKIGYVMLEAKHGNKGRKQRQKEAAAQGLPFAEPVQPSTPKPAKPKAAPGEGAKTRRKRLAGWMQALGSEATGRESGLKQTDIAKRIGAPDSWMSTNFGHLQSAAAKLLGHLMGPKDAIHYLEQLGREDPKEYERLLGHPFEDVKASERTRAPFTPIQAISASEKARLAKKRDDEQRQIGRDFPLVPVRSELSGLPPEEKRPLPPHRQKAHDISVERDTQAKLDRARAEREAEEKKREDALAAGEVPHYTHDDRIKAQVAWGGDKSPETDPYKTVMKENPAHLAKILASKKIRRPRRLSQRVLDAATAARAERLAREREKSGDKGSEGGEKGSEGVSESELINVVVNALAAGRISPRGARAMLEDIYLSR